MDEVIKGPKDGAAFISQTGRVKQEKWQMLHAGWCRPFEGRHLYHFHALVVAGYN